MDYLDKKKRCFFTEESTPFNSQLPPENTLKFFLKSKATITFRPSGTEPKLKVYFSTYRHSPPAYADLECVKQKAMEELKDLEVEVNCLLDHLTNEQLPL